MEAREPRELQGGQQAGDSGESVLHSSLSLKAQEPGELPAWALAEGWQVETQGELVFQFTSEDSLARIILYKLGGERAEGGEQPIFFFYGF